MKPEIEINRKERKDHIEKPSLGSLCSFVANSNSAFGLRPSFGLRNSGFGFTLTEVIVALGLGTMVLTVVGILTLFGLFSFAALGNYTDLDAQSRNALDVLNREIRQATAVVALQTNLPVCSLTLTNAEQGKTITVTWDSDLQTLSLAETGLPTKVYLTKCSDWKVSLYTRAPTVSPTNIAFNPAPTLAQCKLINMTWKCSRPVLVRQRINTESVQTAQVVLRNDISN